MNAARIRPKQAGYTLIEVVVSMAIAGIAIAALLQAVEGNAVRIALSRQYVTATAIGESILARVGRDVELDPGVERGRLDDAFSWQRTIRPYHAPVVGSGGEEVTMPVSAYEVIVSVNWRSAGRPHNISLRSLRLKAEPDHAPI